MTYTFLTLFLIAWAMAILVMVRRQQPTFDENQAEIQRLHQRLEDPNSDEREETESLVRQVLEHGAIDPRERQTADRRLTQILAAKTSADTSAMPDTFDS